MFTKEQIDALISQIEGLSSTRPLFYLKFCGQKEFAEKVVSGLLYANTPEFFRQQELKSGIRGQGDKNELTLSFKAESMTVYDYETGNFAFTLTDPNIGFKYNDDNKIPMVCFVGIPLRDMKFITADDTHAEFDFPFMEMEFDEMASTFGPYCVIIGARELEDKIRRKCNELETDYIFEPVQYVVSNSFEKMKAYVNGEKERFLFKDKDLSYQREYRLALPVEIPEDHYIHIEKLSNAKIISSKELKNLRMSVGYKSYRKEEEK